MKCISTLCGQKKNVLFVGNTFRVLYITAGKIELPDVTITSIPSAHNEGDEMKAEGGSNYIYLIETGGLRIAHFGDIGQDALTVEQLATLGEIDLAFTQLSNGYSNMNSSNQKGLNLMKQVKPHLIVPTHFDKFTLEQLIQEWANGYFIAQGPAILSKDKIPAGTGLFFMAESAIAFGKVYSLQEWKWSNEKDGLQPRFTRLVTLKDSSNNSFKVAAMFYQILYRA